MILAPYLRFILAASVLYNLLDIVFNQDDSPVGFILVFGMLGFTFILYCIIEGIQEIKNKRIVHAKYLSLYGLVFESLILSGNLLVFLIMGFPKLFIDKILALILVVGLLFLIVFDFKKFIGSRTTDNIR